MNLQEDPAIKVYDKEVQVDFRRVIKKVLSSWHWIAFSIFICVLISYVYLRYQTPIYKISARVLVNDEKKGAGLGASNEVLADFGGLLGTKSTVDNEAEVLKTRYLMEQVVKDKKLNIKYYKEGYIRNVELYESPFFIKEVKFADTIKNMHVVVNILDNNKLLVKGNGIDTTVNFNAVINIDKIGDLQIVRNPSVPILFDEYGFDIESIDSRVSELMKDLTVGVNNKLITIIDLSLNYPIPKKGEEILTHLIYRYVQSNINDKNEVADSTIKFIKNRLSFISGELGSLEGNIQGFKQKNNLADMSEQARLVVQNTSQYTNELAKIETQISILKSLQSYLSDDVTNEKILPSSLIPVDMVFNAAVQKYNELTLERSKRLIGVSVNNPTIILLDKQIASSRADIEANISSTLSGYIITRNKLNNQINQLESQVRNIPENERNYLNLARQQQIKQELYIFLMQKSEETAISKTSNIANSKTIDPSKSEFKPFSPKNSVVYFLGLFCGFLIPIGIILIKDFFNDRIQTKDEILKITNVPVVGEISHNDDTTNLVVSNSSRSPISEQFRALRTNLSFFLQDKSEKIILLTSSMSGEGKSFVGVNLGNILALSNKKVLIMELDLRKPGVSNKLNITNKIGFSNYVVNDSLTTKDIIRPLDIHEGLYIISSGPIPPNPAELLLSNRTRLLFDELKKQFDYIIIDSPPIGIVTDAQLLAEYADICLYLVRQKYTYKSQLNIVSDLYANRKMKKMGIVVNDIDLSDSYGYGYGYGYGYTYGDYGKSQSEKSIWQRIKRFPK